MSDESSEIEQNIAEYIAALSAAACPTGVLSPPELITANDVPVRRRRWRQRLIDVEGWLNLPTPLDVSSPEAFAESLSAALWSRSPSWSRALTRLFQDFRSGLQGRRLSANATSKLMDSTG